MKAPWSPGSLWYALRLSVNTDTLAGREARLPLHSSGDTLTDKLLLFKFPFPRLPDLHQPLIVFQTHVRCSWFWFFFLLFKKILFIYLLLERGRQGDINVWLPLTCPPTGDLACEPGMYPDWESNRQPFGSQAGTQSTEPHQSETLIYLVRIISPKLEVISLRRNSKYSIYFWVLFWQEHKF